MLLLIEHNIIYISSINYVSIKEIAFKNLNTAFLSYIVLILGCTIASFTTCSL